MKNSDRPAMPVEDDNVRRLHGLCSGESLGLTKREMLAMHMMQALTPIYWDTAEEYENAEDLVKCLAESSVEQADALLKELEK